LYGSFWPARGKTFKTSETARSRGPDKFVGVAAIQVCTAQFVQIVRFTLERHPNDQTSFRFIQRPLQLHAERSLVLSCYLQNEVLGTREK
jgi:hypothetical protein